MILNVFQVLIHALKKCIIKFLIYNVYDVDVCYSENVAFIFKSCATYFYLRFFYLVFTLVIFLSVTAIL